MNRAERRAGKKRSVRLDRRTRLSVIKVDKLAHEERLINNAIQAVLLEERKQRALAR